MIQHMVLPPWQSSASVAQSLPACCHNHSHKHGLAGGLVTVLHGSHRHCTVFQSGQVCKVSIEKLHTHGVLTDGHLDGLFKATHHIRCLLIFYITSEYCELMELYAVSERHPVPWAKTFGLYPIDARPRVFFMHVFDDAIPLCLGFATNKLVE